MLTHIHDADDDDVVIFFTSFLGSPFISSPYFGVSIKFRNEHLIFVFFSFLAEVSPGVGVMFVEVCWPYLLV